MSININKFNNSSISQYSILLIFGVVIFGLLFFVMPVEYIFIGMIATIIAIFFFIKPEISYLLVIFTLPFNAFYVHYVAMHDALAFITLAAVLFRIIFLNERVNLHTPLNKWILIIVLYYIFAGFHSLDYARGVLYVIRFIEAIIYYYLTIYFIRTHRIKISTIIKVIVFTAASQAFLGIIQGTTFRFGAQNAFYNRGYLGYLGIGPSLVKPARGTFVHFAIYGYYLSMILLFLVPFYKFIFKKKFLAIIVMLMLFAGIFVSYSRGAMSGLILCYLYYVFLIEKNKMKFIKITAILALILTPVVIYLLNAGYADSLNPRNEIWTIHLAYLQSHLQNIWLGTGLQSQYINIFPYIGYGIPLESFQRLSVSPYIANRGGHNLLLTYIEELGLVGTILYLSFLANIFIYTLKNISLHKLNGLLCLSVNLILAVIIYSGINDHIFRHPHMIMLFMLFTGLIYANNSKLHKKVY